MATINDWHKVLIKPTDNISKGIKVLHDIGLLENPLLLVHLLKKVRFYLTIMSLQNAQVPV